MTINNDYVLLDGGQVLLEYTILYKAMDFEPKSIHSQNQILNSL